MYLGHYLAWVCAGVMGAAAALVLKRPLVELDAGEVAFQSLGLSGIVVVIVAGWATSNPTLYRAGLALQAVTPGWPRWLVTLLAGIGTSLIACFPFVFTKLLSFVALFGILLSPVGAIVFVEHWLFPRLGYRQYWFSSTGRSISWPALAAWVIAVGIALALWYWEILHEFFIAVPLWFVSAGFYLAFAAVAGARSLAPGAEPELQAVSRGDSAPATTLLPKPVWLRLVGWVAVVTLLMAIVLPIWLVSDKIAFPQRLAGYYTALSATSIVHLACVACWVLVGERGNHE
jgi:NCS1 family nucleobase:cation symporter-1